MPLTLGWTTIDTRRGSSRTARFYFGQIVWAWIDDRHGKTKERPAVIIDNDIDDLTAVDILVIPITKGAQNPCPPYHIQVHDSTTKRPLTGLYYSCWAKCNWARVLEIRRINSLSGCMPTDLLKTIVDA